MIATETRNTEYSRDVRSQRDSILCQGNGIEKHRAWMFIGWVTSELFCSCTQSDCLVTWGGSEVNFKGFGPQVELEKSCKHYFLKK